MTINEMIEQGITIQGDRKVTALAPNFMETGEELTLYDGDDGEWSWNSLDEEWADWDINYMYAKDRQLVIELDNPDA